jgi:hypothetical protein
MLQVNRMRWPPNRVVDWADASERQAWVAELRSHVSNIFVLGYEGLSPRWWPRGWTLKGIRESLVANREVIVRMLHLAGAPLESWEKMPISLWPPPRFADSTGGAVGFPIPFRALPRHAWSEKELILFFGCVMGQLEYLAGLLEVAFPEESEEQRRARWAVIRLRVLFEKLQVGLGVAPMRT